MASCDTDSDVTLDLDFLTTSNCDKEVSKNSVKIIIKNPFWDSDDSDDTSDHSETLLKQEIEDITKEIGIAGSNAKMEPTVFTSEDILRKSVCTPTDTIKPERGPSGTSNVDTIYLGDIDIDSSANDDHYKLSRYDTLKHYYLAKSNESIE